MVSRRTGVSRAFHGRLTRVFSQPANTISSLNKWDLRWNKAERLVVVIVDYSGSMSSHVAPIKMQLASLVDRKAFGRDVATHFIAFSGYAQDAVDLGSMQFTAGSTFIATGFERLNRLLAFHGTPKSLDIVFVSDGEDTDERRYLKSGHVGSDTPILLGLPPLPVESRIFTVSVGPDFPAKLAFETLFPKYGKRNDPTTAGTIPMDSPSDAEWAFKTLAEQVCCVQPRKIPTADDVREGMPLDELYDVALRGYNVCMNRLFVPPPECSAASNLKVPKLEAIGNALSILDRAKDVAMKCVRSDKLAARTGGAGPEVTCKTTVRGVLDYILKLNHALRKRKDEVERGAILSDLERRNAVGTGVRCVFGLPFLLCVCPTDGLAEQDRARRGEGPQVLWRRLFQVPGARRGGDQGGVRGRWRGPSG
jgi:hypothetical protein